MKRPWTLATVLADCDLNRIIVEIGQTKMRRRLAPLILFLACDTGAREDAVNVMPTTLLRDSAGVVIAESSAPPWNERTAWRVSEQPLLDIGGSLTDTAVQFTGITSVHRMPNGNVAVLDVGSYSLRFFDPQGKLVGRAGRRGDGPGEFTRTYTPRAFSCGSDTLYVPRLGEILVFATNGGFVRQFQITPTVGKYPTVQGCSGDRILAWTQTEDPIQRAGNHRMSGTFALYDLSGASKGVLGMFPMEDHIYSYHQGEGWGYLPAPYGRRRVTAMSGDRVATGMGDTFELEIRDHSGALQRILRAQGLQKPLIESEIQRFRDFVLPRVGYARGMDTSLTAAKLPATIPAYAAIHFDGANNLWVREYDFADAVIFFDRPLRNSGTRERSAEQPMRRWYVFQEDGGLLGEVALPPRFDIRQVGDDWVLGVWRSELNVQHVRMYRLLKPG